MVRTLALSSGDHGLKARSDYSLLNFFLSCPWFNSLVGLVNGQLVCLQSVGILNSCRFVDCFIGPEKPLWGAVN